MIVGDDETMKDGCATMMFILAVMPSSLYGFFFNEVLLLMLSMGVGAILLISMICAYTGTEEHMPSKEEKSGRRNDCDSCGLPITISDRATYKTIDGENFIMHARCRRELNRMSRSQRTTIKELLKEHGHL